MCVHACVCVCALRDGWECVRRDQGKGLRAYSRCGERLSIRDLCASSYRSLGREAACVYSGDSSSRVVDDASDGCGFNCHVFGCVRCVSVSGVVPCAPTPGPALAKTERNHRVESEHDVCVESAH